MHRLQQMLERSMAQDWPCGVLYVVATPIGNLADLSLRAWQALLRCDVIAAEDTRATRTLVQAWGVETPLLAAHRHNEARAAQAIVARLQAGERVALVSDAGSPAVSDPGARIVRAVHAAGLRVVPIPGPSAALAALMASGATSDENPAFVFAGFAPPRSAARQRWLQHWCALPAPAVIYEVPHRLPACLADIVAVAGPARELTIARELTKRFEEIVTLPAGEAAGWLAAHGQRQRGEFVLIVHAAVARDTPDDPAVDAAHRLAVILLEHLSVRDVARVLARACDLGRDDAYRLALAASQAGSE
ncbi:MAG: 16S rRNA (cytidine(1402)-2'-O)-methyltransferase [Castellaniella sp.]